MSPVREFLGQVGEPIASKCADRDAGRRGGDRAPPVPRGERDFRGVVFAVCGQQQRDIVAARGVVARACSRAASAEASLEVAQVQLAGQVGRHRAVLTEEPLHQRLVVVAVVGRHLLDVRQLGSEPAGLLDRGHRCGRPLPRLLGGGLALQVAVLRRGAVGADQPLRRARCRSRSPAARPSPS